MNKESTSVKRFFGVRVVVREIWAFVLLGEALFRRGLSFLK